MSVSTDPITNLWVTARHANPCLKKSVLDQTIQAVPHRP